MKTEIHNSSLEPISVIIRYDLSLYQITKKASDTTICSDGCTFMFILQSIFIEHPLIAQLYPPGSLGFTVNGEPPDADRPMRDGDVIDLIT